MSFQNVIGLWGTRIDSSDEVPVEFEERSLKNAREYLKGNFENGAPSRNVPKAVLKGYTGRVMAAVFDPRACVERLPPSNTTKLLFLPC